MNMIVFVEVKKISNKGVLALMKWIAENTIWEQLQRLYSDLMTIRKWKENCVKKRENKFR